jgi:hypothetical protein
MSSTEFSVHSLCACPTLTHTLSYRLTTTGEMEWAEAYTEVEVGGAYNITQARTLKRL